MTAVTVRLAEGQQIGADSFTDLTTLPVTDVRFVADGRLRVEFDGELSTDETRAVRLRIMSATAEEEALMADLTAPEPAPGATLADQVAALQAQVTALTRLILGETEQETP